MAAYERSTPFSAHQTPAGVTAQIPPITFTGPGTSSTLPVGPCRKIYGVKYPNVEGGGGRAATPFKYVEVDWNTEGTPRGPGGSFSSAHFDFHFYLESKAWVDARVRCDSDPAPTCNPQYTSYRQMRRFLTLPPVDAIPVGYFPDTGSSIPEMGLHLLDRCFAYETRFVDHYPTLIYGTFDGRVLFAEASVTLQTLQDAIVAPGHTIAFAFRQPRRVQGGVPWPSRFSITYHPSTGGFSVAFTKASGAPKPVKSPAITRQCPPPNPPPNPVPNPGAGTASVDALHAHPTQGDPASS